MLGLVSLWGLVGVGSSVARPQLQHAPGGIHKLKPCPPSTPPSPSPPAANIESLAVGLTENKALFTIVATGTDTFVANLVKQISKLVNVRYVEDITNFKRIGG